MYDLPPSMTPIVTAVGMSAAISIAHIYGGREVYIPQAKNLKESHPIAGLLGLPLARKLAQAFGAGQLRVPVCPRMIEEQRTKRILADVDSGLSANEVAQRFCLTSRSVRLIVARNRVAAKA